MVVLYLILLNLTRQTLVGFLVLINQSRQTIHFHHYPRQTFTCDHFPRQIFSGFLDLITLSRHFQDRLSSISKKDLFTCSYNPRQPSWFLVLVARLDYLSKILKADSLLPCTHYPRQTNQISCSHYLRQTLAGFLVRNSKGRLVPDILFSLPQADFR